MREILSQCPTKIVSISILRDITKIPIAAGTDCLIRSLLIDLLPKSEILESLIYDFTNGILAQLLIHLANNLTQFGSSFRQGIVMKFSPPAS